MDRVEGHASCSGRALRSVLPGHTLSRLASQGGNAAHFSKRNVTKTTFRDSGSALTRRLRRDLSSTRQQAPARQQQQRVVATLAGEASDRPSTHAERSVLINNELVLLIFQLDLDAQLQRALLYENFDTAQEIRARRQAVDEALEKLQESKSKHGEAGGVTSSRGRRAEAADLATEGLRLRSEMQRAIDEERYEDAASVRDRLKELEQASADARAVAAEWGGDGAGEASSMAFRLGQRVTHKELGYRGVIAGWDDVCCESSEWQQRAGVSSLARGPSQPFYHLLVDVRDAGPPGSGRGGGGADGDDEAPPIAYVAEELLEAPEPPTTWLEQHGPGGLQHPYSYLLFLGQDGAGDLLPVRQLRDKFNAARRDVYSSGEEEEEQEDEDGGDGGDNDGDGDSGGKGGEGI